MDELKLSRYALVRPIKTSFRFSSKPKLPSLSSGHGETNKDTTNPSQPSDKLLSDKIVRPARPRAKSSDSRDYGFCGAYQPSTSDLSGSVMQTLDRKISASSDQLDSLKKSKYCEQPKRARSSSRVSYERKYQENEKLTSELLEYKCYKADPTMKMRVESIHKTSQRKVSRQGRARSKTPFEMFLEDDGPYSRKLYGPVTPTTCSQRQRSGERQNGFLSSHDGERDRPPLNKERIVYTNKLCALTNIQGESDDPQDQENNQKSAMKGLLWQQKDRIFSRWKERFFLLTKDYLHSFKKESNSATEMGAFLSKLKLSDVEEVSLLTKKGYLTISLSHVKDGRVFLRRHEGIKEWYNMIKAYVYESRKRRQFWAGSDGCDQSSVEAWLLGRQQVGNNRTTPRRRTISRERTSDDSGLESGHSSMNTATSTQSDDTSSSVYFPSTARRSRLDSFRMKTRRGKKDKRKSEVTII